MSLDVMKQALEALQEAVFYLSSEYTCVEKECEVAITALRAAIEQAQRNEFNPDWDQVEALRASLREHMAEIHRLRASIEQAQPVFELGFGWLDDATKYQRGTKLYATPPRQWQGLTDEEIAEIAATPAAIPGAYVHSFAHAIEAKLKEKNT